MTIIIFNFMATLLHFQMLHHPLDEAKKVNRPNISACAYHPPSSHRPIRSTLSWLVRVGLMSFARKIRPFIPSKFSLRIPCQEACWNKLRLEACWILLPSSLQGGFNSPKVPPVFKHFLIKLEYWNIRCGFRPSFWDQVPAKKLIDSSYTMIIT